MISLLGFVRFRQVHLPALHQLTEIANDGEIWVDGEQIRMVHKNGTSKPASQKQVDHIRSELGMVFQSFNLWSHTTILQNVIEGPVHALKRPRSGVHRRGRGIAGKRSASPTSAMPIQPLLSGGQQQRALRSRGRSP